MSAVCLSDGWEGVRPGFPDEFPDTWSPAAIGVAAARSRARFRLVTWLLIGWTIAVTAITAFIAVAGDDPLWTDPVVGLWLAVALWLNVAIPLVIAWIVFRPRVTPARVAVVILGSIVALPLAYYLWYLALSFYTYGGFVR